MAAPEQSASAYRFGTFQVDLHSGELHKKGVRIRLQGKPFQALALLLEHGGGLVTREELRQQLWAVDTFVEFDDGLNAVIKRLRLALGDSAENPRFVETVPRRGYRFLAPILAETAAELRPVPKRKLAASPGAGVADVSAGSIAVLPLENLSQDPAQEYFVEGLTDELTTCLARIPTLSVISRTSVMQYKGTSKGVPEIGRELGVDAILEGTVQRSGTRVRLRVQLIQTETDRHLWAESYDRELTDILDLESELAQDVARQVNVQIASQESTPVRTRAVNPTAFESYLKGRYFWNLRNGNALDKAIEYFQRATEADPTYALPYAGLADTYVLLGTYVGRFGDYLSLAREAAVRALSLDSTLSEAHTALALIAEHEYNLSEAEREYKLALTLGPNNATAHHWYASGYLVHLRRFEEANRVMKQALLLDPVSRIVATSWGAMLYFERRYGEAFRELSKVIDMAPEFAEARTFRALVLAEQRNYDQALADLQSARRRDNTPRRLALLGWGFGVSGRRAQAKGVLAKLKVLSKRTYVSPWSFALLYLGLGDKQRAIDWLEKAYLEHMLELIVLRVGPLYDPLRCDPRFGKLVARVGLLEQ